MSKQLQHKQESVDLSVLDDFRSEFSDAIKVRKELLRIPRLKLVQTSSPAFKQRQAEEGEFFCEQSGELFGKEVTITPLIMSESSSFIAKDGMLVCFSPDMITNKDGILCKNCPHGEYWNDWGTKESPKNPECKASIDVICLVNDNLMPHVFSFRKMSHKTGKVLFNMMAHDIKRIPFGSRYTIKSEKEKRENFEYMIVSKAIKKEALAEDEILKIVPIARQMLDYKRKGAIEVEHDTEDSNDLPI